MGVDTFGERHAGVLGGVLQQAAQFRVVDAGLVRKAWPPAGNQRPLQRIKPGEIDVVPDRQEAAGAQIRVNASGGGGVTAAVMGQNVSIGGAAATSTLGATAATTSTSAAAAQQASSDTTQQLAKDTTPEDESKKKQAKGPVLTRRVGRVTVILPKT